MKQQIRIDKYEKILDKSNKIISELTILLDEYRNVQPELSALAKYYGSRTWMRDFTDYEQNKLPKNIKAGILSEDAIYNILDNNREIAKDMQKIAMNILKK